MGDRVWRPYPPRKGRGWRKTWPERRRSHFGARRGAQQVAAQPAPGSAENELLRLPTHAQSLSPAREPRGLRAPCPPPKFGMEFLRGIVAPWAARRARVGRESPELCAGSSRGALHAPKERRNVHS